MSCCSLLCHSLRLTATCRPHIRQVSSVSTETWYQRLLQIFFLRFRHDLPCLRGSSWVKSVIVVCKARWRLCHCKSAIYTCQVLDKSACLDCKLRFEAVLAYRAAHVCCKLCTDFINEFNSSLIICENAHNFHSVQMHICDLLFSQQWWPFDSHVAYEAMQELKRTSRSRYKLFLCLLSVQQCCKYLASRKEDQASHACWQLIKMIYNVLFDHVDEVCVVDAKTCLLSIAYKMHNGCHAELDHLRAFRCTVLISLNATLKLVYNCDDCWATSLHFQKGLHFCRLSRDDGRFESLDALSKGILFTLIV